MEIQEHWGDWEHPIYEVVAYGVAIQVAILTSEVDDKVQDLLLLAATICLLSKEEIEMMVKVVATYEAMDGEVFVFSWKCHWFETPKGHILLDSIYNPYIREGEFWIFETCWLKTKSLIKLES